MTKRRLKSLLRRELFLKLGIAIIAIAATMTVVLAVDNMLVSFVLAFVTNYLLAPIVDFLERRGLSRQAAITIPFVAAGLVIAFGIYSVLPLLASQASALEAKLPKYQSDLLNLLAASEYRIQKYFNIHSDLSATINTWIINKTAALSSEIPSWVSGSLTVLLLTPLFAYFMLQDGRTVSRKFLKMVPNSLFETTLQLHHRLNDQMGGFIRARFIEAAIVGLVVWLGLQIIDFPYATLLGLFAAITNLIPYIGPIIGAIPALFIVLVSEDAVIAQSINLNLFLVTTVYFFAQLIDIVFIIPLVVARIVNLHPLTVIIVIIIGAQIMGIIGMVISIPVASAIKLIFQAFYDHVLESRQ